MNRRIAWNALPVAAAAAALAAAPSLGAGTNSLTLKAPSSVKAGKTFTVTAKGHAAKHLKLRVYFDFSGKKCTAKAVGEDNRDTFLALLRDVGPGDFKKQRQLKDSNVEKARICGYLTPGENPATKPVVRAHRKIEFTKP